MIGGSRKSYQKPEGEAMPRVNEYKCSKCDLRLPRGWGSCLYVVDDNGARVLCWHPVEGRIVNEVLGDRATITEVVRARTGFNSSCICLDCLHQFEADLGERCWSPYRLNLERDLPRPIRDKRQCPSCKSKNVKTELEMVGKPCPECEEGVIEETWTGAVS